MKTRQGWTLGAINCVVERDGGVEACCMVTREVVLEALYEAFEAAGGVVRVRNVREVVDGGEDGVLVRFEGGGSEEGEDERFDFVVGADGIWSRCRKVIAGGDQLSEPEYRYVHLLFSFLTVQIATDDPAHVEVSLPSVASSRPSTSSLPQPPVQCPTHSPKYR
jgi:2-polyprenyl-6-methoxyphenol hydroxylase-like FAD-dependent oxidoreductase